MMISYPDGNYDESKCSSAQLSACQAIHRIIYIEKQLIPFLKAHLSLQPFIDDTGKCTNHLDYCEHTYTVDFLRMGNFIRLGGEIEIFFQQYYGERKGIPWRSKSCANPVFQKVLMNEKKKIPLVEYFKKHLSVDISKLPKFVSIQRYFVDRHLYTHQTGLADEQYLKQVALVWDERSAEKIRKSIFAAGRDENLENVVVYDFSAIRERFEMYLDDATEFVQSFPKA